MNCRCENCKYVLSDKVNKYLQMFERMLIQSAEKSKIARDFLIQGKILLTEKTAR